MAKPIASTTTTMTTEELAALAARLTDHADSITNVAAHDMEVDIRLAAAALRRIETPAPALTLFGIAAGCSDQTTALKLRQLIGEAA